MFDSVLTIAGGIAGQIVTTTLATIGLWRLIRHQVGVRRSARELATSERISLREALEQIRDEPIRKSVLLSATPMTALLLGRILLDVAQAFSLGGWSALLFVGASTLVLIALVRQPPGVVLALFNLIGSFATLMLIIACACLAVAPFFIVWGVVVRRLNS